MNRKQLIASWSALLVIAFLCVSLAGFQLHTTMEVKVIGKTMTSRVIEPSATLELTNTSSATPIIVPTIQPSETFTLVSTETSTPLILTADFLKQTQQIEEQIQKATPAG
ncbi:MAG: hypothetical protein HY044_00175 [Candidatus Woesebacteria bacterium]|nr:MAG: hypothetical protein HY044_00175 [Candidatus Woesebacteria bacterium]